jgi:serine protease Do
MSRTEGAVPAKYNEGREMSRPVLALSFALVATVFGLLGLVVGGGGPGTLRALSPVIAPGHASFADVVQRVNPAVVNISVIENGTDDEEGDDVEDEEAPEEDSDEPLPPGPRRGEGSGFIVDPAGYILTNHHVVASPEKIRVRLADKRELTATLVGSDPSTDLALLKVKAGGLPVVPLGDSDTLRVGEWVAAIGNPYRFDHSVTVGVVSSKGRKIYDASFDAYIQTDAAINPGNSGGPLINAAGEAVGINSAVSVQGQGIGFAIPINVAREILEQLRTRGHVSRGYLGIQLKEVDPDLQKLVHLKDARGALVEDVQEGSAGEKAGLKRYDVITAVSGKPVEDGDQLVRVIAARPPGSDVVLSVFRDGRTIQVTAHLAERAALVRPKNPPDVVDDTAGGGDALGLVVTEPAKDQLAPFAVPEDRTGVMIRDVVGLSPGAEALAEGDLVVEVNRRRTRDVATYRKALEMLKADDAAWLFVYRPRARAAFLTKLEVEDAR